MCQFLNRSVEVQINTTQELISNARSLIGTPIKTTLMLLAISL